MLHGQSQSLQLVTKAAELPLTVVEMKRHLRLPVSVNDDDSQLVSMINTATLQTEDYIRKSLITQTWNLFLDGWPRSQQDVWWDGIREGPVGGVHADQLRLPLGPLQSVTHVKTYDDSDVATTFAAANYFVDTAKDRLVLRVGQAWPAFERVANGIEIQYVTGYGKSGTVPTPIRQALRQHVANMYEHRGDEAIPPLSRSLLRPYKEARL